MCNVVSLLGITIVSSTHQCYVKKPHTMDNIFIGECMDWKRAAHMKTPMLKKMADGPGRSEQLTMADRTQTL